MSKEFHGFSTQMKEFQREHDEGGEKALWGDGQAFEDAAEEAYQKGYVEGFVAGRFERGKVQGYSDGRQLTEEEKESE